MRSRMRYLDVFSETQIKKGFPLYDETMKCYGINMDIVNW